MEHRRGRFAALLVSVSIVLAGFSPRAAHAAGIGAAISGAGGMHVWADDAKAFFGENLP